MFATLQEVQDGPVKDVAGYCPTSPEFIQLVNSATKRLMIRGDWAGLVVPIQVCTTGGCIVWPRYVGQVRAMNVCNRPITMRNTWYNFLQFDNPRFYDGGIAGYGQFGGTGGGWWGTSSWGSWLGVSAYTTGGVNTPVFQDIMGDGRLVRFYPLVQADVGKTVTVFGIDNGGNTLRHKLSDGTWEDGWVVTLAIPFASTTDYVRRIDRLIFEDHESTVRAYAYNVADDVLEEIGTYEGHDNNPTFIRYNLTTNASGVNCSSGNCACVKSIVALVKLRYIPARYPTDLVLISNQEALSLMVQCLKYEKAGDREAARAAEFDAIRELNLELTDEFPVEQTSIGNGVFAGTGIGRQKCF